MLPDRETLLGWLAAKAEDRSAPHDTAAIKLLLEELRREDDGAGGSEFDELDDNVTPLRRSA